MAFTASLLLRNLECKNYEQPTFVAEVLRNFCRRAFFPSWALPPSQLFRKGVRAGSLTTMRASCKHTYGAGPVEKQEG